MTSIIMRNDAPEASSASQDNVYGRDLTNQSMENGDIEEVPTPIPTFPARSSIQRISTKQSSSTILSDIVSSQQLPAEEPKTEDGQGDFRAVQSQQQQQQQQHQQQVPPPTIPPRTTVQRIRSRQSPSIIADVLTAQRLLAAEEPTADDETDEKYDDDLKPRSRWNSSSSSPVSPSRGNRKSPICSRNHNPILSPSDHKFSPSVTTRQLHHLQREQRRSNNEDAALDKLKRDRLERAHQNKNRFSFPSVQADNRGGGGHPQHACEEGKRGLSAPALTATPYSRRNMGYHNEPTAMAFPESYPCGDATDNPVAMVAAEVVPSPEELENQLKKVVTEEIRREMDTMRFHSTMPPQPTPPPPPIAEAVVLNSTTNVQEPEEINKVNNKSDQCDGMNRWACILCGLIVLVVGITIGLVVGLGCNGNRVASQPTIPQVANEANEHNCIAVNYPDVYDGLQNKNDQEVLASLPDTLCYERIPYQGLSRSCPTSIPRPLGTGISNLIAESQLWYLPEADISLVNAGQVKLDLCAGNFTLEMANALLPYDNTVVLLTLNGAELVNLLEQALDHLSREFSIGIGNGGGYPYGAGIRYWVNMMESFPNRLTVVQVNPQLETKSWKPIDLDRNFTIAISSYLANGGDGYTPLATVPHEDTGILVRDIFVDFCKENGVLLDPPNSQYSTQDYIHDPSLFDI